MLYYYEQFSNLERMTDEELMTEIVQAKEKYIYYQEYFIKFEEEYANDFKMLNTIPVRILTDTMANIESYIRKAENLMYLYDENCYTRKSYNNRQIILGKKVKKKNHILKNTKVHTKTETKKIPTATTNTNEPNINVLRNKLKKRKRGALIKCI